MKVYLLSTIGERHEDRIPEGIFSSYEFCIIYLKNLYPKAKFIKTDYSSGDHGPCTEIDIQVNEEGYYIYLLEEFFLDNIKPLPPLPSENELLKLLNAR